MQGGDDAGRQLQRDHAEQERAHGTGTEHDTRRAQQRRAQQREDARARLAAQHARDEMAGAAGAAEAREAFYASLRTSMDAPTAAPDALRDACPQVSDRSGRSPGVGGGGGREGGGSLGMGGDSGEEDEDVELDSWGASEEEEGEEEEGTEEKLKRELLRPYWRAIRVGRRMAERAEQRAANIR